MEAPVTFSADEIKTVEALIEDWGFEYSLTADRLKVIALAKRIGLDDLAKRLEV